VKKYLCSAWVALALFSQVAWSDDLTQLPEYTARRLGETSQLDLASLRGQVLMLNSWATWCAPCRSEMPGLTALAQRYAARGLTLIGVNVDEGRAEETVLRYVYSMDLNFTILRDPANHFTKKFRTLGVPETLLFDRSGKLIHHWRGAFDTQSDETRTLIEAALTADGDAPAKLTARGRRLARQRGCIACHATDSSRGDGPGWGGIAGTTTTLADGRKVLRDAAYLTRAITEPDADIVAGYVPGVMAAAIPGKTLGTEDVAALVTYIQSLGLSR